MRFPDNTGFLSAAHTKSQTARAPARRRRKNRWLHLARRRRKNREVMGSTPIGEAFAFSPVVYVWGGGGGGAGEEAVEQPRASSLLLAKSPERERPFGSQELLPPGASSPWMCALLVSLLASVIIRPVLAPSTT